MVRGLLGPGLTSDSADADVLSCETICRPGDTHVAAALDPVGGLLGVQEFPATAPGYARLLGWLGGFGTVCLVGIEVATRGRTW